MLFFLSFFFFFFVVAHNFFSCPCRSPDISSGRDVTAHVFQHAALWRDGAHGGQYERSGDAVSGSRLSVRLHGASSAAKLLLRPRPVPDACTGVVVQTEEQTRERKWVRLLRRGAWVAAAVSVRSAPLRCQPLDPPHNISSAEPWL